MILKYAQDNPAIMSGVSGTTSFSIKATAKSFGILSSGLYANKIRAIQRELGCNALDSHIEAGKADQPFEVHLPSQLEPWYSIRDFGVGLDHHTATSIFTTFFESTKTDSNDFIGALGLGSKSPFSYTNNFTVTTVKNGRKGIYTAFIADDGTPSFAQMGEEQTTEPNGVEIRFAVEENNDYRRFAEECTFVYKHFPVKPIIIGKPNFSFSKSEYQECDIVSGISRLTSRNNSVAIMGNIEYPIDIPNAQTTLGYLAPLLRCGLEIKFANGELDFQASREGLSYIAFTIDAIKAKLKMLHANLYSKFIDKVNSFTSEWEKAEFLVKSTHDDLWKSSAVKYITDTKYEYVTSRNSDYFYPTSFSFKETELEQKFNIALSCFETRRYSSSISIHRADTEYENGVHYKNWKIGIDTNSTFVINDEKRGATTTAKYHWKNNSSTARTGCVYVLNAADATKPILANEFLKCIANPPNVAVSSGLLHDTTKIKVGKSGIRVFQLHNKNPHSWNNMNFVWRDVGKLSEFDNSVNYYLPLSGLNSTGQLEGRNLKNIIDKLGIKSLKASTIYGLRKDGQAAVANLKNWINFEDHIRSYLKSLTKTDLLNFCIGEINIPGIFTANSILTKIKPNITNKDNAFIAVCNMLSDIKPESINRQSFNELCKLYAPNISFDTGVQHIKEAITKVNDIYPMLKLISNVHEHHSHIVVDYINMIDSTVTQKGSNQC